MLCGALMRTCLTFALLCSLVGCGGSTASEAADTRAPTTGAETEAPGVEAAGYGGVRFVATGGAIQRVSADGSRAVLAADAGPVSAMLRVGGTLYLGTADGAVKRASLADGAVSALVDGLSPVLAMTLDHVGYLVVATEERGLLRVTLAGETTPIQDLRASALEFDQEARLLRADAQELDYLALTGDPRGDWEARDAREMRPFTVRGVELTGAEYWPNRGDAEPDYPADVLWGFYPEEGVVFEGERSPASATREAVACAEQSFRALRTWIEGATDAQLARLADGAPRFYLWVNDYSTASDPFPHEVRPARFWFWRRNPAVEGRVPGYWKWETTLTQDGVCHIPEAEQIERYLTEWEG